VFPAFGKSDKEALMNQPTDQIISALRLRRDVLPNIALLWLAKDSLSRAEMTEGRHQSYLCVASITFAALAVEAFLNVIGASLIKRWEDLEGTTSPAGKLAVIENSLGLNIDRSRIPFNAFRDLFRFRNTIVHAKPDFLPMALVPEAESSLLIARGKMPLATWEKEASLKNSHRLVSRSESMISFLAEQTKINLPSDDHAVHKAWLDIQGESR
jgi:hypothetical protein